MDKMNSLSIVAWIGLLTLIFLVVVYSAGFKNSFGAFTGGITGVVSQLQGHPSQAVLSKAA
jgi:heme O synthase-like polyprenyltransferase